MPFAIEKPTNRKVLTGSTTGATQGMDKLKLLQLLTPLDALIIENYFVYSQGDIEKRGGSKKLAEVLSNTNNISVFFKYTDNIYLIGYGKVLAAFDKTLKTITAIKSNFTTNLQDGVKYGAYSFTCNGTGEKIYRTSQVLNYDAQSANFTVGATVTGTTSGATGIIIEDSDSGTTGTLTLSSISGYFLNNEQITDSVTGVAVANGANTYATVEITDAPYCNRLCIFENRLIAGDIVRGTKTDRSKIIASEQNADGTVPYFNNWTISTTATDGFEIFYANAGQVNDMKVYDNKGTTGVPQQLFVSYADGWACYHREVFDSAGNMVQDIKTDYKKINSGGTGKMSPTPNGMFLGNETGEFFVRPDGSWVNLSSTWDNIEKLDQSNSDRVYLPEYDLVFITTREDSTKNNVVYWIDITTVEQPKVAWGKITGWSISRFLIDGEDLYGGSDNTPKILSLMPNNVYDDEGCDIYTTYSQPLNVGSLNTIKDLLRIDIAGFLTPDNPLTVHIDGITELGDTQEDVLSFMYKASDLTSSIDGWGYSEFGVSGLGESEKVVDGTVWYPAFEDHLKAYGYMTYIVRITGHDKVYHSLAYVSVNISEIRQQRNNILT